MTAKKKVPDQLMCKIEINVYLPGKFGLSEAENDAFVMCFEDAAWAELQAVLTHVREALEREPEMPKGTAEAMILKVTP